MLAKERDPLNNNNNHSKELEEFEKAASILANLAVEEIFLSRQTLQKILREEFSLSPALMKTLVEIFAKKNNGGDPNKQTSP